MSIDVDTAIFGRRSVREYTEEGVDEGVIRQLIGAAIQAPSAVNQQPWSFTVVRNRGVLDRLSNAARSHMLETLGSDDHSKHFRPILENPAFQIFYHAPALILISAGAPGPWIIEDCSLAAENLMLAAYGIKLGACWIGFAQNYLNTPAGKEMLGLPAQCVPIAPIILGHPKGLPPPVARQEPQIHWID
jgi:nitroreductase